MKGNIIQACGSECLARGMLVRRRKLRRRNNNQDDNQNNHWNWGLLSERHSWEAAGGWSVTEAVVRGDHTLLGGGSATLCSSNVSVFAEGTYTYLFAFYKWEKLKCRFLFWFNVIVPHSVFTPFTICVYSLLPDSVFQKSFWWISRNPW